MVYTLFGKKTSWSKTLTTQNKLAGGAVKNKIMSNQELAEELRKAIVRKFEKRKVHSSFYRQYLGIDLNGMQ